MLSEQKVKNVAESIKSQYPRAWSHCHIEGDPETDDFIILVCKELNILDRTVGCNGKRRTDEKSHDAIWNDGRIVDIVNGAGGSNPSIGYNDVTLDSTVGGVVMGKFIDPIPLRTHFPYTEPSALGISHFGGIGLYLHDRGRHNEFISFFKTIPRLKYVRLFYYLADGPWGIVGTGHRSDAERNSAFRAVCTELHSLGILTQVTVFGTWVENESRRNGIISACKASIRALPKEWFYFIDCYNEPGAIGVPEYGFVRDCGRQMSDLGIHISLASPNSLHMGIDGRRATDAEVATDTSKLYDGMPAQVSVITPHWGRAPWEPHRNLGGSSRGKKIVNDEPRGIESSVSYILSPEDFKKDRESSTRAGEDYTLHGEPGIWHGYCDTSSNPEWEHNNSIKIWQEVPRINEIIAAITGGEVTEMGALNPYPVPEAAYWEPFEKEAAALYKKAGVDLPAQVFEAGRHMARTAWDFADKLSPEASKEKHLNELAAQLGVSR